MQRKVIIIGDPLLGSQAAEYLRCQGNTNLEIIDDSEAKNLGIDLFHNTESERSVSALEIIKQSSDQIRPSRAERRALKRKRNKNL